MEDEVSGLDVLLGLFAYVPVLNLFPMVRRSKSRFLLFHSRQGLYLFSVALGVFVLCLGLFYVFLRVVEWPFGQRMFAVLVVIDVATYAVLVLLMLGSVAQKRMTMLPVLGELAGER